MHKTLYSRDDRDYIRQEMKEKKGSPALRIALIHHHDDSNSLLTGKKEIPMTANRKNTDNTKKKKSSFLGDRNGKKIHCMDISNDNLAKSRVKNTDIAKKGKP